MSTEFPDWLNAYNYRRSHSALGGRPPISRVSPNLMAGYS